MTSIASRSAWWLAIEAGLRLLALCVAGWGVSARAQASLNESYRIRPTDILIIEVAAEPKLASKEFRVTGSGEISYPFVGAVKVLDRTPAEVQAELKSLLEADYLVNAQVMVQVKEFRKRLVYVLGQVNRAGPVEIPAERRMTVIEAITFAGGTTRLARTSDIQLTRSGRAEPMRFSLEDQRNPEKAIALEDGDVIFIPESRI